MTLSAVILMMVLSSAPEAAIKEAEERFAKGDAAGAADAYEAAVAAGIHSADVYFNLGTAALQAKDPGRAVWGLLQARALAPMDGDVWHNLGLARLLVQDQLAGADEPPWVTAASALPRPTLQWVAWAAYAALCGLLILRAVQGRAFVPDRWLLRFALVTTSLAVVSLSAELALATPRATVIPAEVVARSVSRADGPESFKLHAGATVQVVSGPAQGMVRVRLSNGLEGYVAVPQLRVVTPEPWATQPAPAAMAP